MSFGTAFISCSAYAVGIYSASCPNIANNRSFPVVNKPSPSSEKHMSSNPESENIGIEHGSILDPVALPDGRISIAISSRKPVRSMSLLRKVVG